MPPVMSAAAGRMKHAPASEEPGHAGALVADVDRELAGARAGDEVRGAEQIEEPLAREPAPAADDLVLHDARCAPRGRRTP